MTLIDADVFLAYLIFSKHIDSLKCRDVKEAVEMSKVDVINKIRAEIVELDVFYDNDYFSGNRDAMLKRNDVLQIIDNYKAESEDKE